MSQVFLKLLNMSITAGWLVLAVLALRLLLKKAPKWVSVALWGLVAVRLLCPVSLESSFSLIPSAQVISPGIMLDPAPQLHTGIPVVNSVINPIIAGAFTPDPATSANPLQIWVPIATALWIAGMVIMSVYAMVSYVLLRRKVATAVPLEQNVYQSEHVASPFVLGVFRPRIYLPFQMEQIHHPYVIAHEQAHIARRDHLWKPLGFALLTLHWFNPLLWLGYVLLCRDIELACDEKAIRHMDNEEKADYTQALVACSISHRSIAACPLAFGEVGVKERIKTVMHYKKPAFWLVIAAVVLCVAVAVCFLTDPQSVDAPLATFIDCQIAGHFQTEETEGRASCVNWEVLGTEKRGTVTTVYMWVLYEEYSLRDQQLYLETGTYIPTLITVKWEDDTYKLIEYWTPGDGAFLTAGIREKFPWYLQEKALDSQRYIHRQQEENREMAWAYFRNAEAEQKETALVPNVHGELMAVAGDRAVSLISFSDTATIRDYHNAVRWLTIDQAEAFFQPFTLTQNGSDVIGICNAFDAETYQPVEFFLPSGLAPHTYLFSNADLSREYIVLVSLTTEDNGPTYAFGVTFEQNMGTGSNVIAYEQNADGTWQAEGRTYRYRLEITGRMHNAQAVSTFVYLSNLESISFEQAWKAAGLSSNSSDYFRPEDALLVEWRSKPI